MHSDLETPEADWSSIDAILKELRAGNEDLAVFVDGLLADLEDIRGELVAREQRLDAECREIREASHKAESDHLRGEERRLNAEAEQLAEKRQELETAVARFQSQREEWKSAQDAAKGSEQKQLDELQIERETLSSELAEAHRRVQELSSGEKLLAELETELAAARRELAELRETSSSADIDSGERIAALERERDRLRAELEDARSDATRTGNAVVELAEARKELAEARATIARKREADGGDTGFARELHDQIANLELERSELESELEVVRNRAAGLAENAAVEKRRMAEERAAWTGELRELRQALEMHAQFSEKNAPTPGVPISATGSSALPPGAADPVLDAVKAQFELLQKDRARRRGGASSKVKQEVA